MSDTQGFDLARAKPVAAREDEGQAVHLHDERGEPMYFEGSKPVTMTVVGTYSSRYRRAEEAMSRRRLKMGRKALDSEAIRRDRLALAAECVIAWDGFFDNGEPIRCERATVERVLEVAPWIRDQIEAAMEDHAGFFGSSSGN